MRRAQILPVVVAPLVVAVVALLVAVRRQLDGEAVDAWARASHGSRIPHPPAVAYSSRMRRAAVFLLLFGCGEPSSSPLDASVDGTVKKDAASDAAKDAASDACVQPKEQCGEPCPGSFFPKPLVTPTAKSVCTAKQIDDLWTTCLGDFADKTACLALLKANDPCTACLWTSEANAAVGGARRGCGQPPPHERSRLSRGDEHRPVLWRWSGAHAPV